MPFLTHNMARPPTDFCGACLRGHRRCKIPDATLSGRAIFLSVEASARPIGLFLPHIMAADRLRKTRVKSVKKGHATLCGSTVCALVLYLQRLQRYFRHITWRKSARIWFLSTFGDVLRDSVYKVIYKGETPLAT